MDKQFDELSKSLAEGVSRREALRKFVVETMRIHPCAGDATQYAPGM